MTGKEDFPIYAEETSFERLDRLAQAHKFEMERLQLKEAESTKRSKIDLRKARQETWQITAIAFFISAVILGIAAAIYFGTREDGGPDGISREERREIACVENGGGYVPEDLLYETDSGLCVYPGERAAG